MSKYDGIDFPGGKWIWRDAMTRPEYNGEPIANKSYFITPDGRYFEFRESRFIELIFLFRLCNWLLFNCPLNLPILLVKR